MKKKLQRNSINQKKIKLNNKKLVNPTHKMLLSFDHRIMQWPS